MQNYEIDLNGNPYNEFSQGSDSIRVTKLLTNNWNKDESVFRISKVKDGKPKHSVDVTDKNFTKIHKSAANLPDTIFEIGGAILGGETPYIITDIYGTDLLYTTGLGRTAPIRLSYSLSEGETYLPKDKFELTLHNTLKGRDWIIWDKGEFYLLFHYQDKIYKKIKFDKDYDQNSFYGKEVVVGNPELICKPYQIDTVVFIEDVTYNDSPQALDATNVRSINKPYQAENIPFNNMDQRLETLNNHIFRRYPNDFLPMQWENKEWIQPTNDISPVKGVNNIMEDVDMDSEMNYAHSEYTIPFRVLDKPTADFTYSPFRRNIIAFDGAEMHVLLDDKPASEIFSIFNDELMEFIEPGKSLHWKKYDHISWKERTNDNYSEYVNPSPLKRGYLKLKGTINGKMELIPNRDIPIRDYNAPLMYCLYRYLGSDERSDETYFEFKPQYKQGDKIVLKPSVWDLAQLYYVGERDDNNKQIQLEGKALEDLWLKAIKEDDAFSNYTIKWQDNVLWANPNKTLEERTSYITEIDFRGDHFVYHSYEATFNEKRKILREEEIMCRVSEITFTGNVASIDV